MPAVAPDGIVPLHDRLAATWWSPAIAAFSDIASERRTASASAPASFMPLPSVIQRTAPGTPRAPRPRTAPRIGIGNEHHLLVTERGIMELGDGTLRTAGIHHAVTIDTSHGARSVPCPPTRYPGVR